ncbi:phage terminase large subunit [Clostridium sp.]|uniref:phage terminase large subunit n=1 Tax=Clostridium sp. TaxID=1506 RepID=UPI00345DBAF7
MNKDDFNKVDMSIRGELLLGYFKQITLTFNPWSEKHWLKKRFFDVEDEDILALTTTYKVNEFLGDDDRLIFEKMKKNNPRRI